MVFVRMLVVVKVENIVWWVKVIMVYFFKLYGVFLVFDCFFCFFVNCFLWEVVNVLFY